jgi:hypothetical protein
VQIYIEAKFMKKYVIFLLVIILIGCGKWKTNKMKSGRLCEINAGDSLGNVMLKYDNDGILNISFKIEVKKNRIYIADNVLKRVQVLDNNCEPVLYIGENKQGITENSSVKYSKFQFSIIDAIAVDSNGNIYIQNNFSPSQKNNNQISGKEIGFALSYILVFDQKGNLIYTLGRTGSPDIPFTSIESLSIDKKDRLFIMTKSYDMWSVYRFTNRRRDFNINFIESDFKEVDGKDSLIGKIEKIIANQNGDKLLISVGYYTGINFKNRKIFRYSIQKEKSLETAFVINEPKNELFAMADDRIYLWDIDEKLIRYIVCNLNGDIVNNISLNFPEAANYFNEILIDGSGNFYSYGASKKGVEILDWR